MGKPTIIALCLLGILLRTTSFGQHNIDTTKSLLWRVSGKGLSKPSYLFGTFHLLCPDDYLWTKEMQESFDASDVACFEIDLGDSAIMRKAMEGIQDRHGTMLKSYFTPEEYTVVRKYFLDKAHIDLDKRQTSRLSSLLSQIAKIDLGCSGIVSYEINLSHAAVAAGKKTASLEELKEQEDLFDLLPKDKLARAIVGRASGSTLYADVFHRMIAAYKSQDQFLTHKIVETSGVVFVDGFVDERNKKWIPRMAPLMEQSPVFFAFGAGHLGGENGVIQLLKNAGYTVEPIHSTTAVVPFQAYEKPTPPFDLKQYLTENLHYPEDARKQNIQGKVLVRFIVNEDGKLSDFNVAKSVGSGCDEEALRVIKLMPSWKPAIRDGKAAKSWYAVPVVFTLH